MLKEVSVRITSLLSASLFLLVVHTVFLRGKYLIALLSIWFVSLTWSVAQSNATDDEEASATRTGIGGVLTDASTNEPLIGATVMIPPKYGAEADENGRFFIAVQPGEYLVKIRYIGYDSLDQKVKVVRNKTTTLTVALNPYTLNTVEVFADYAKFRETPVAFSTIESRQIAEELAGRDLAMLANSTPGVYASETGGGTGDARVTIRGFDDRNIAVLIDGIPVNDMENGRVFWSNWDGLGDMTERMQIQRGLGPTKLAVASIGGTMNITTRGIDSKMGGYVKQDFGNNLWLKTSVGFTTGRLKNGWALTLNGTYRRGDGWVDATDSRAFSYFVKVQKAVGKHLFTFTANGAPQWHGQRNGMRPIWLYDTTYFRKLQERAIDKPNVEEGQTLPQPVETYLQPFRRPYSNYGPRYNENWGIRYATGNPEKIITTVNYYHKPLMSLSHSWEKSDKFSLNTTAYLSFGSGGGTNFTGNTRRIDSTYWYVASPTDGQLVFDQELYDKYAPYRGQLDLDFTYRGNRQIFDLTLVNDTSQKKQTAGMLRTSINEHTWFGAITTAVWKPTNMHTLTYGADVRGYYGNRRREVYDLLGADYHVFNQDRSGYLGGNTVRRKGDLIDYLYKSQLYWTGLFAQYELRTDKLSAFVTLTGAMSISKRFSYLAPKDLVLPETTLVQVLELGAQYVYNGQTYTVNSPEARYSETNWNIFPGFTSKAGVNYNFSRHLNVYTNLGFLSQPPKFVNIYSSSNRLIRDVANETVFSTELGVGWRSRVFAANLSGYFTQWFNKPPGAPRQYQDPITELPLFFTINGMRSQHTGVEFDFAFNILKNLTLEGLVSLGDWRYQSAKTVFLENEQGILLDSVSFSAKGVKVGDAAQTQLGASIRYEPIKGLYIKPRITYFADYYAEFDPFNLKTTGPDANRNSWVMPAYFLVDLHAGYSLKFGKKYILAFNGSILNLLNDRTYITDAQNGTYFDPGSALVYMGQGLRFNMGVKFSF
jgi:hypothetical protein